MRKVAVRSAWLKLENEDSSCDHCSGRTHSFVGGGGWIRRQQSAQQEPNQADNYTPDIPRLGGSASTSAAEEHAEPYGVIDLLEVARIVNDPGRAGLDVILDARNEAMFARGHIPGAILCDPYNIDRYIDMASSMALGAQRVIVYCHGGNCEDSYLLCQELIVYGVPRENLYVFKGGWEAWQKHMEDYAEGRVEIKLGRSHEYASSIVRGLMFDEIFEFNATVANTGLITNLPDRCAVEVPVIASKAGFSPIHVGALPPQCAALNQINTTVIEFAVESAIAGDPQAAYLACCFDPVAASVLSLAEIKQMTAEMFAKNRRHLPTFKKIDL